MSKMIGWLTMGCTTERDKHNQRVFSLWTLAWGLSWLAGLFLLSREILPATPAVAAALSILPIALALQALRAYRRFLGQTDELIRQIELNALALGFGAGIVGAMLLVLVQEAELWLEAGPNEIILVMVFGYVLGVIGGHRRYAA